MHAPALRRPPRSHFVLGWALVALLGGCAPRCGPPAPAGHGTLLFTADLHGSIEPCGCSDRMRGGLSRVAKLMEDARAGGRPVFYFDSGSALFPSRDLPEMAVGQHERLAQAIAQAFGLMGLTRRVPGPLDDARGPGFRASLNLPELAPGAVHVVPLNGQRVAVLSAASPAAAQELAARARREGAVFVVALVPLAFEAASPGLAEAPAVDLVLASQPRDELAAEENRLTGEGTRLVQVQSKGRSLLRVDLVVRGPGPTAWLKGRGERDREVAGLDERIELTRTQVNDPTQSPELKALRGAKLDELLARRAALVAEPDVVPAEGNFATVSFVPVEPSVQQEPRVARVEKAYHRDVGQLNLAWAKLHGRDCAQPTPEAPGFVGSTVCASCHAEAFVVWQATKHPRAYEALAREGKQYHLDCIGCHVSGWQVAGGVCRVDKTERREEVGCESCHGPGSQHMLGTGKTTIQRGDSSETCVRCHDRTNSPDFDYQLYLQKIRGPGHGLPGVLPKPVMRR